MGVGLKSYSCQPHVLSLVEVEFGMLQLNTTGGAITVFQPDVPRETECLICKPLCQNLSDWVQKPGF